MSLLLPLEAVGRDIIILLIVITDLAFCIVCYNGVVSYPSGLCRPVRVSANGECFKFDGE
jgi:hypothetical protein